MKITHFPACTPPRVEKDVSADTVSGDPRQFVELMYSGQNDTMKSGIWESSAGVFRASYEGIVEYCYILEGGATITSSDGTSITVNAGDGFVLDQGLQTEWTVDTFIKKQFFICTV